MDMGLVVRVLEHRVGNFDTRNRVDDRVIFLVCTHRWDGASMRRVGRCGLGVSMHVHHLDHAPRRFVRSRPATERNRREIATRFLVWLVLSEDASTTETRTFGC